DALLRRVVAAGVPAAEAIRHVSLVPFRHYGLRDQGAVAPGYRADLAVLDDLRDFRVHAVLKAGRVVARDGAYLGPKSIGSFPCINPIRCDVPSPDAFRLQPASETCPVIGVIPDQILTRRETRTVRLHHGRWAFDAAQDVLLIASLERHHNTGS